MFENVRAWLNSSRNYFKGVAILQKAGGDEDLLTILVKGPNEFRVKRLGEEMLSLYENLKSNNNGNTNHAPVVSSVDPHVAADRNAEAISLPQKNNPPAKRGVAEDANPDEPNANLELYTACKLEAEQDYKKVMNMRAVLFSLANVEDFTDPNMPDKVKAREKMAIDVVTGFQKVSELYDRAEYVKQHGHLPFTEEDNKQEYDALPDYLVKQQLDNARKALNKLKKKESSPERVALMQKHEENIKKLEEQWRSLKPQ